MRAIRWALLLPLSTLTMLTIACDSGEAERKDLEAAAAAALGADKDKETQEREAKEAEERRKAFEERKTKEAAVEGQLQALEIGLVALPTKKLPKDLEAACTALIEIYPDWIRAIYFDDDATQLAFFDAKSKNLGEVKGNCAKVGSVEAAACMIQVIEGVSAEGFPEADRKAIQGKPDHFFDACATKYPRK